MEEPDYDDMINDYIEDDFEPPVDDYEAMYEEIMDSSAPIATKEPPKVSNNETSITQTQAFTQAIKENDTTSDVMSLDLLTTTSVTTPHTGNDEEMSVHDYRSRQQEDANLYNFERYNKKADWRKTPLSPNAKSQNKKNSFKNKTPSTLFMQQMRKKTTAPDANLMNLMKRRHRTSTPVMKLSKYGKSAILLKPKEGQASVPMTLANGTRIYVKTTSVENRDTSKNNNNSAEIFPTCSLGVTMKELKRRSDLIQRKCSLRKNDNISSSKRGIVDNGQLWVDKHAPSSFTHLLSDERTNREVLRALRAWDPYVFGKKAPARPISYIQFQKQQQNDTDGINKPPENPHDKRPDESNRVILLAGPPGVGKTTLAHIIARHAGYRPMEVNASDERSASVLTDRVRRAMESTTIKLTSNHPDHGKPNCLILDEIDGADAKGAIQSLVEIIRAELPAKGSKKKTAPYLRRPIIFICNHKYAPALRPLLPVARHFNVDPPSASRLVARLKAVLSREKINMMAGGSLLHQLVLSSGGDIRSSLFSLQFASAQALQAKDTSADISQALTLSLGGSGLKDDRGDMAATLTTVFRKVKTKAVNSLVERDDRASVTRVLNAVEGLNDDSATMNALFLNLPRVSYIDPTFDRCSAAHEWLSGADVLGSGGEGYGSTRLHTPSMAAAIHLLCRVELKPDLNFSTREFSDVYYQRETNLGLVQKFSEGLPAKAKGMKCQGLLTTELVPYALWMLSAGTGNASLSRAASSIDILTKLERESVDAHVSLLRALGLTYLSTVVEEPEFNQKRKDAFQHTASMQKQMVLEPPIDRLVVYRQLKQFPDLRRIPIPPAMKEMIAHQVKLESFRQKDDKPISSISSKSPTVFKESQRTSPTSVVDQTRNKDVESQQAVNKPPKTAAVPSSTPRKLIARKLDDIALSVPLPKRIKTSPKSTSKNFLGIGAKRAKQAQSARKKAAVGLTSSKKNKLAHTGSGFRLNQVIRLRYVKGFTQAVRTPCRQKDLE